MLSVEIDAVGKLQLIPPPTSSINPGDTGFTDDEDMVFSASLVVCSVAGMVVVIAGAAVVLAMPLTRLLKLKPQSQTFFNAKPTSTIRTFFSNNRPWICFYIPRQ